MGPNYYETVVKYGKVFLLATALIVVALSESTSAQRKMIDCRKFVFAPPCRGIAAKRDTQSHTSTIRFTPPADDGDYFMDSQKAPSSDDFVSMNGLLGLLKKAISKNVEMDTGSNYLP